MRTCFLARSFSQSTTRTRTTTKKKKKKKNTRKLWHILYEDGDKEDFNEKELKEGISLFQKSQSQQYNEDENDDKEKGESEDE